jgi:chromosome segregation ATPase
MRLFSSAPSRYLLIIILVAITSNFNVESYTPDLLVRVFSLQWSSVVRGGSGGGWSRLFRLPQAQRYRKLLQEQTALLDQQLRQSQEELLHVKKRFKSLQVQQMQGTASSVSSVTKGRQLDVAQKRTIHTLKQQVAQLEQEISRINAMKDEIQSLLTAQQEKVQTLQEQLATASTESVAAKELFERHLTALQQELEAKTTGLLEELRTMMEEKMQVALEQARLSAAKELKEAVEKTEHRVQQQAEKRLQEEQRKAQEAVEQEKVKMRKLVKALATREKKLLAKTEKEPKTATRLSASSADKQAARKADTVRGPLK